jgi:hypothetical protein
MIFNSAPDSRVLDFSPMRFGAVHLRDLAAPNRRFELHKRRQPFIRSRNETLPVVAMCISNPDRSPVGINR